MWWELGLKKKMDSIFYRYLDFGFYTSKMPCFNFWVFFFEGGGWRRSELADSVAKRGQGWGSGLICCTDLVPGYSVFYEIYLDPMLEIWKPMYKNHFLHFHRLAYTQVFIEMLPYTSPLIFTT